MQQIYPSQEDPVKGLYDTALVLIDAIRPQGYKNIKTIDENNIHTWTIYQETANNGSVGWGVDAHASVAYLDELDRPILAIGYRYRNNSSVYANLLVRADGAFMLICAPYGNDQRRRLAESSFLDWGWAGGRKQWYVSTGHKQIGLNLEDPTARVNYVAEKVLLNTWCWVRRGVAGFEILPVKNPHFGWARNERLRARRYRLRAVERDGRGRPVRTRPSTVRHGNETLNTEQSIQAITAMLTVSAPAKSTPLRRVRPTEALERVT